MPPPAAVSTDRPDGVLGAATRRLFADDRPSLDLPGGCRLVRQGEPVEALILILSGRALATRRFQGEDVPVAELGPGVLVGLEGLCGTGRHGLTVSTLGPVRLLDLPRGEVLERLRTDPEAALLLFSVLAGRLRACIAQTDDLRFRDATARVARYLRDCLDPPDPDGGARGRLLFPKKTLAAHLGVTQQSLSRVLRRLRAEGITVRGSVISVADVDALDDLALADAEPEDLS